MQFSSANSINIGRLTPQIVYYVYAYTRLLADGVIRKGDPVNFVVPTGNFGNILAAYYAKRMGLPIGKLICASNSNKVLFDFFTTGIYDRNREFVLTSSPSMDILISSNLERLIYHISGDSAEACASFMRELRESGKYAITPAMREGLSDFVSGYTDEIQTAEEIRTVYNGDGYVIDPHTAVASSVYRRYRAQTGDLTPSVIDSTASPFKFEGSVMAALGKDCSLPDLELADKLSETAGVPVPKAVSDLRDAPVLHDIVCDRTQMKEEVRKFLGL
jgi:threonine synthase